MLDFIRVAAAVPPVAVANPAQNALHCIKMAQEAEKNSPQLVVFPELCLTGYTCGDLFFQQALLTGGQGRFGAGCGGQQGAAGCAGRWLAA